jgi:uncharacterized protein YndB with AHSA1/START domain
MRQLRGTSTIVQSRIIPAPPELVYAMLADPRRHAAFTGARVTGRAASGAPFTAMGGYIRGRTLRAAPARHLVQEWLTTDWPADTAPSRVEWRFAPHPRGTRLTLHQTGVPRTQARAYRAGWIQYYWRPLRTFIAKARPTKPRRKSPATR